MKRFKKIYVEITNACNMKCPYCPGSKRACQYITPQQFDKVLNDISPFTDYVYLHVMGEPLVHPSLDTLLALCSTHKLNVNITTNGLNLSKTTEVLLGSNRVRQINISLHSYAYTSNKQAWLTEILSFARLAALASVHVNLRLWNLDSVCLDNDDAASVHNEYVFETLTREFELAPDTLSQSASGSPHGISLAKNIYIHISKQFVWPDISGAEIFLHGKCYGLKNHVGILVDGTVVPCCLDGSGAMPLGNLYKTPFSEIITSSRAENIINGFRCGRVVETFCKTCGFTKNLSSY